MNPIQRYVHRKEIIHNTPFVIESDGQGYYIDGKKKVPKKLFEQQHNIAVVPRVNLKGQNPAACNRWMNNDINLNQ